MAPRTGFSRVHLRPACWRALGARHRRWWHASPDRSTRRLLARVRLDRAAEVETLLRARSAADLALRLRWAAQWATDPVQLPALLALAVRGTRAAETTPRALLVTLLRAANAHPVSPRNIDLLLVLAAAGAGFIGPRGAISRALWEHLRGLHVLAADAFRPNVLTLLAMPALPAADLARLCRVPRGPFADLLAHPAADASVWRAAVTESVMSAEGPQAVAAHPDAWRDPTVRQLLEAHYDPATRARFGRTLAQQVLTGPPRDLGLALATLAAVDPAHAARLIPRLPARRLQGCPRAALAPAFGAAHPVPELLFLALGRRSRRARRRPAVPNAPPPSGR